MKTMHRLSTVAAVLAAVVLAACQNIPERPFPGPGAPAVNLNGLLSTPDHLTLYTFDHDVANSGKSACNGACMNQWMPFKARADERPVDGYTVVVREDGQRQWAWRGWPLYTFSRDVSGGDINGNNYQGLWHLVRVGESAMLFN